MFMLSYSSAAINTHVAWGVYKLTDSEAAAGVTGTGMAIASGKAATIALSGAKWGAKLGAYAGPVGIASGAVVGGL